MLFILILDPDKVGLVNTTLFINPEVLIVPNIVGLINIDPDKVVLSCNQFVELISTLSYSLNELHKKVLLL